jgi:hypothetical protein
MDYKIEKSPYIENNKNNVKVHFRRINNPAGTRNLIPKIADSYGKLNSKASIKFRDLISQPDVDVEKMVNFIKEHKPKPHPGK